MPDGPGRQAACDTAGAALPSRMAERERVQALSRAVEGRLAKVPSMFAGCSAGRDDPHCTEAMNHMFWAIRGGGGGSFGVLTRLTLRTHELPEWFGSAAMVVKGQSDDAFRRLVRKFVEFYAAGLLNPHWGEAVAIRADNTLKVSM